MMVRSLWPWLNTRGVVVLGAGLALLAAVSLAGPPTPAIEVFSGAQAVANGTGSVYIGSSLIASPKVQTFTVKNTGTAPLTLQEPIALPPGFTLAASFGSTTLAPAASTTFAVALNAARAGRMTGTVSFANNDATNNPFTFAISGDAMPPPGLRYVDNGAVGFATTGTWANVPGGFQGDCAAAAGGAGNTATWTVTGLEPGYYRVAATWPANPSAARAMLTVYDDKNALDSAIFDQRFASLGFTDAKATWADLGVSGGKGLGTFLITSGSLVVKVSELSIPNPPDTLLLADAVRIERVGYPGGTILDNGADGFSTAGTWSANGTNGFAQDSLTASNGNGANMASWVFAGLVSGQYRLSVSWPKDPGAATDAPFAVLVNGQPVVSARLNQRLDPAGLDDAHTTWQDLAVALDVPQGTVEVRLTDAANGPVIADAVRIERVNTPVQDTVADVGRFLEQATWGPNNDLITAVQQAGIRATLEQQLAQGVSTFPDLPLVPNTAPNPAPTPTYSRDNYSMYPLQNFFFTNALYGPNQLRQRVAWAFHQVLVVSGVDVTHPSQIKPYLEVLERGAFGNYRTLLEEITLNPAMGRYLNMAGNRFAANLDPNENYGREILQLFSIGLVKLKSDGTPVRDQNGNAFPTYDQAVVHDFARVFTGWNYASYPVAGITNYIDPMVLTPANHDPGTKVLLNGLTLPAKQLGAVDLQQALDNIFNHPNVGPFIALRLIQHLVTSNPSSPYVARVAAVFDNNGAGVRGDMKAVLRAILLDPEARGDLKTSPTYGHLREPAQYICNLLRAFNTKSVDGTQPSDGYLNPQAVNMGQDVYRPPSVFSYYSPGYNISGTNPPVKGPEYQLLNTATAIRRANFVSTMVYGNIAVSINSPNGTSLDLTGLTQLAGNPWALVEALNQLLLHGTMSPEMKNSIVTAVNAVSPSNPKRRAQAALYLVATSSQYQVEK
jgi:uncharacterized protein (DUF1800 family)